LPARGAARGVGPSTSEPAFRPAAAGTGRTPV